MNTQMFNLNTAAVYVSNSMIDFMGSFEWKEK